MVASLTKFKHKSAFHWTITSQTVLTYNFLANITIQSFPSDLFVAYWTHASHFIGLNQTALMNWCPTDFWIQNLIYLFKPSCNYFIVFLKILLLNKKFSVIFYFMGLALNLYQKLSDLFLWRLIVKGLLKDWLARTLHWCTFN